MIRKANIEDIKRIMKIINKTIVEMRNYNNTQWDESYPQEKDFVNDIKERNLYVTEIGGSLLGFVCINKTKSVEYNRVNWSLDEDCMVVHRMAVNPCYREIGIATKLMNFADELALENNIRYLKTDTYSVNIKMNELLKKCGYNMTGKISFFGKEKVFYCYEKILKLI
ncbi:GNAT family N-acetyltransferase [Clostridium sp. LBM24168]